MTDRPNSLHRIGGFLATAGRMARDGWLVLGIALVILVGLEFAYRGQAAARRLATGEPEVPAAHPYADSVWYREYRAEYDRSTQLEWRPYVYYRRPPFSGAQINIDSLQHRVTVHTEPVPSDAPSVFFFGGSTMWGDYQRDAKTIPSVVVSDLALAGTPVRAVNFGESGYVMTQGVLELQVQLRLGARPDMVVFYDGINDVAAAVQSGQAGIPQNEFNRADEFRLGRAVSGWEEGYGIGADLRAAALLGLRGAERSQLLQRLLVAVRASPAPPDPQGEVALAEQVLAVYLGTVDLVEALAERYGFEAIYVWQPNPHVSEKPMTAYEEGISRGLSADTFQARLGAVHAALDARLPAAMSERVGDRYAHLTGIFQAHAGPVWVDQIGHTTEEAAEVIAHALAERLRSGLAAE